MLLNEAPGAPGRGPAGKEAYAHRRYGVHHGGGGRLLAVGLPILLQAQIRRATGLARFLVDNDVHVSPSSVGCIRSDNGVEFTTR